MYLAMHLVINFVHAYMVPSCYLCYNILYTVLTFVHSLQKEFNDKIAEVVFKESNNNNKVFCLNKSYLVYLNPFSSDYSSWLNDHVRMLIIVSYMDIYSYNIAYTCYI